MSITTSLRRAAQLQEKIEGLRSKLATLLEQARTELAAAPVEEIPVLSRRPGRPKMLKGRMKKRALAAAGVPVARVGKVGRPSKANKIDGRSRAARALKAGKRSPLAGVKRAASPSGPLAPAVVKVLSSHRKPMNVRDILAGLMSSGYKFNSPEPKKNLAARIYRLKGVKQVSSGLFATA